MSPPGATGAPAVVVFGTGFGCLTHVRALRAAGLEVAAVVGRDPDRTAERARRFDVPRACTSVEEALALPGVAAAAIATPPHTHAELVHAALDAGLHVVCEKPFARDAAEAAAMAEAAERAGVVHLLGTEFRWSPDQEVLRRIVAAGTLGQPREAMFVLDCPMIADPGAEVPAWWADAAQGGGWLGAYGSHVVDQVQSTLGPVASVSAALSIGTARGMTADDGYAVRFRTATGVEGVMRSSARARDFFAATRVIGADATAWLADGTVWIADADGQRSTPIPAELELPPAEPPPTEGLSTAYELVHTMGVEYGPYVRLYERFGALVGGVDVPDVPPAATFHDGWRGMLVLDAIRRSAAAGGEVAEIPA